jgi:hypothetical protein
MMRLTAHLSIRVSCQWVGGGGVGGGIVYIIEGEGGEEEGVVGEKRKRT